ncbi:MAG: hypothetical protein IPK79_12985 [Vampirovibrionales bacterium]|nr:hypothetical protein [Vampirovibrionales bacterium]
MTQDTEKVIPISQRQDKMSRYDLLKSLMSTKEITTNASKARRYGLFLTILTLLVIAGLYGRSQLGYKPTAIDEALGAKQCPIIGNVDSKLYHTPKEHHYLELLQRNKARENRICFSQEWEAWLAGYKKSKF